MVSAGLLCLYPFGAWQFPLSFLLVGLSAFFCHALSPADALYCVACGYATQHFSVILHEGICFLLGQPAPGPEDLSPLYFLSRAAVYVLFYFLFARHLTGDKQFHLDTGRSVLSTLVILTVVLLLSVAAGQVRTAGDEPLFFICRLYAAFCCVFFLWVQVSQVRRDKLQADLLFQQQLTRQQREQYAITKETIDLINRKSHDLKHQVAALRTVVPEEQREKYLREMEKAVQIYDSTLQTGNEVLDTVLTEKNLYCEAHQITLTCIADGRQLSFMDGVDVYTIFGNALDNAIECVARLPEAEQRLVSVSVRARSGLALIQVENQLQGDLNFKDGLPQTTKEQKDYHGFGLRSIRYTVEKYGGHMTIHAENGRFLLSLSIPQP